MPSLKDINFIIMTEIFFWRKSIQWGFCLFFNLLFKYMGFFTIWGSLFFLFLTLSFKVIVDSQELQIMYQEISCTLHIHALLLVSCLIIVWYQYEEIDVCVIHRIYSDFTSSTEHSCVCVCVVLVELYFNFNMWNKFIYHSNSMLQIYKWK